MPTIPEAIISDRTSLITPGSNIPAGDNPKTLLRYNIRLAAEEDPELAAHVLDWQAGVDPFGRCGCYDDARPELACPHKKSEVFSWVHMRTISFAGNAKPNSAGIPESSDGSFWQGLRIITFKAEPDRVGEFLSDAGITRDGFSYNISWLYSRYCAWCLEKGHKKLRSLAFSRDMGRRGFTLLRRSEAAS